MNTEHDLQNIRIILVRPSHPGNIGAAARAMKTMGLSRLFLVQPDYFPDARATEMASNADNILQHATVVQTIDEAMRGCELILGTSARERSIPWPLLSAKEAGAQVMQCAHHANVAILFGREEAGLSNEDLQRCHYHVFIPSNPHYPVLNLAQAVQIICYECRMLLATDQATIKEYEPLAQPDEVEGFYEHLEKTLTALKFYDPKNPKQLFSRLKRLFARVQLEEREINILRGLLSAVDKNIS